MKTPLRLLSLSIATLVMAPVAHSQSNGPAASPRQTLTQVVGTTEVTIDYSRPGKKGREIFGDLVPYDAIWRTGANQSTKLKLAGDATIGGVDVPAGEYALYTIPGEDEWTIIVSSNTRLWGAFDYSENSDVARFTAEPDRLSETVETFTINFSDFDGYEALIQLAWDDVGVSFPISTASSSED